MMKINYQERSSARPSMLDAVLEKQRRLKASDKKVAPKVSVFFSAEQDTVVKVTQRVESVVDVAKHRWSSADQIVINAALNCFERYPAMRIGGARLIQEILDGPNSIRAQTGELQKGLRLMIHLVEQEEIITAQNLVAPLKK